MKPHLSRWLNRQAFKPIVAVYLDTMAAVFHTRHDQGERQYCPRVSFTGDDPFGISTT